MSDTPPPLPELTEGTLDPATLDALFADVAAHATLLEVRVKGAPTAHATGGALDLAGARLALAAGARGVQLRYAWDGAVWCDTVLAVGGTFRVVRTRG